ncbi:MAG: methylenetetrahydrofolate--tRNA-(uracil(54)-C(5))-methyltransferase (FADH(2)-oxidizing) TrmFO [Bradymonadales bacterium]|nr:methylenetetrahydrofolate--tRNA-(uracil(54)-C(5))-methyltransferase (FADH(2)-oxidizing) TrmFO [Bradymonadales bacterium]
MNQPAELARPGSPVATVIGAGLAGCEAALQLARRQIPTRLVEMKPRRRSAAHTLDGLAELVCSNSLKSDDLARASGLLKEEMRRAGSALIPLAHQARVPAGAALAVDRHLFSQLVTERISRDPFIEQVCSEATGLPEGWAIIATGPLTADALATEIGKSLGAQHLFFYDAIAPIVEGDSIDRGLVWSQSRYDKGEGADYLNCPLDSDQYQQLVAGLLRAEKVPLHPGEEGRFFEGCLPIETLAERGLDALRYGPMKPVGLVDPRTGRMPHAVLQLRQENREGTAYNLVGFQTRLKQGEQARVFRLIPGLQEALFLRFGSVHRNTFLDGPRLLNADLSVRQKPELHFAGQITGVEGYVESMATGLLAGMAVVSKIAGRTFLPAPHCTALGALAGHVSGELVPSSPIYQPTNIHWGLFPPLERRFPRRERGYQQSKRALEALAAWLEQQSNEESVYAGKDHQEL